MTPCVICHSNGNKVSAGAACPVSPIVATAAITPADPYVVDYPLARRAISIKLAMEVCTRPIRIVHKKWKLSCSLSVFPGAPRRVARVFLCFAGKRIESMSREGNHRPGPHAPLRPDRRAPRQPRRTIRPPELPRQTKKRTGHEPNTRLIDAPALHLEGGARREFVAGPPPRNGLGWRKEPPSCLSSLGCPDEPQAAILRRMLAARPAIHHQIWAGADLHPEWPVGD